MTMCVLQEGMPSGKPDRTNWHHAALVGLAVAVVLTAGCSTRRVSSPAPVEERLGTGRPAEAAAPSAAALPGAENAGRPGYYTVKPGDTLFRIALDSGQSWRDVQSWNNIANPNILEVGQVLRVEPPTNGGAGVAAVTPISPPGVVARPLGSADGSTPAASPLPPAAGSEVPGASGAGVAAAPVPPPVSPPAATGDELSFIWPAQGPIIATFDEARNSKGVSIGGRIGDPVLAAADGRVVYAGAGLRGYGNLVILKHNNTYLTAYAHNQALLVREDQAVRQGQRIAEMGSSDTDRVKLHFEVRRLGKPVDPLQHLPRR